MWPLKKCLQKESRSFWRRKEKPKQYWRERYKSLAENEKQSLSEYGKNVIKYEKIEPHHK